MITTHLALNTTPLSELALSTCGEAAAAATPPAPSNRQDHSSALVLFSKQCPCESPSTCAGWGPQMRMKRPGCRGLGWLRDRQLPQGTLNSGSHRKGCPLQAWPQGPGTRVPNHSAGHPPLAWICLLILSHREQFSRMNPVSSLLTGKWAQGTLGREPNT